MLPINLTKYEKLRKDNIDKKVLFSLLLNESFRWSQNFKNWCLKRNLMNIFYNIFPEDDIENFKSKEISKIIYDFCNGVDKCCICNKDSKFNSFKSGYSLTCSKKCYHEYISRRQSGNNNSFFKWCDDENKIKKARLKQS